MCNDCRDEAHSTCKQSKSIDELPGMHHKETLATVRAMDEVNM